MLRRINNRDFHIVFTTAYDQYAIQAIKYAAFDYLLKPIDIEELKSAVERINQQTSTHFTQRKLEILEANLLSRQTPKKLAIPTLEGFLFFDISHIIHLEAQSNYTLKSLWNFKPHFL